MSEDQVDSRFRKRPSISDVALEAGVSRAAVSKVIRNAYGVSPAMCKRVETAVASWAIVRGLRLERCAARVSRLDLRSLTLGMDSSRKSWRAPPQAWLPPGIN